MKPSVFYILLILFSIACSPKEETNNYVIEKEKLINILYYMHVIDASSKQGVIDNNRNNLVKHRQYKGILIKYDVDRARFDSTMSYYTKRPDQMKVIYEKVEAKIIRKFDSYDPPKSRKNEEDE